MYNKLHLLHIGGRATTISVEPGFRPSDLVYHERKRAVTLGNLTVLYGGIVYDVWPARHGLERYGARM